MSVVSGFFNSRHGIARWITLSLITALELPASAIETDFLGQAQAPRPPESKPSSVPGPKKNDFSPVNRFSLLESDNPREKTKSQEELRKTQSNLTFLLTQLPPGLRRSQILINRAITQTELAKLLLMDSKAQGSSSFKPFLQAAIEDAQEALKVPSLSADLRWRALHAQGVAYLFLDQKQLSRELFEKVLKLNPPPSLSAKLGFFIGEAYFDQNRFREASDFYYRYSRLMPLGMQNLAIYKLAWCMTNLGNFELAERYLGLILKRSLMKSNPASELAQDAVRDLAYLAAHSKRFSESLNRIETRILPAKLKTSFLDELLKSVEATGSIENHTLVLNRLIQKEDQPLKRIEMLLSELRLQRKPYALKSYEKAFLKLQSALDRMIFAKNEQVPDKLDQEIGAEVQILIKVYLDTYLGKIRSPEAISPSESLATLKNLFRFYQRALREKPNEIKVMTLWSDFCLQIQDWPGVFEVSTLILEGSKKTGSNRLDPLRERAHLDQIAAFQNGVSGDSKQKNPRSAQFLGLLQSFIREFPRSDQWPSVVRIYAQNAWKAKEFEPLLPILIDLVKKTGNEEDFYRLQFTRFQLQAYSDILEDSRGKKFLEKKGKVSEIYRESALELAQVWKRKGNREEYKKNLNLFYALSSDLSKRVIARVDYLRDLMKDRPLEEVAEELLKTPAPDRESSEILAFSEALWKVSIDQGLLDWSWKLTQWILQFHVDPSWTLRRQISQKLTDRIPRVSDLLILSPQERESWLSSLVFVQPDRVIRYAQEQTTKLSNAERKLVALALKIQLDQRKLIRSEELELLLGKNYPFLEPISSERTAIEKKVKEIQIPDLESLSDSQQAKQAQAVITQVQALRPLLKKSLQSDSPDQKIRNLSAARDLEKNVAQMILHSPLPQGIRDQQVNDYKKGLEEGAQEFERQADSYDRLIQQVQQEGLQENLLLEQRTLLSVDPDDWEWPKVLGSYRSSLKKQIDEHQVLAALTLLDYYRPIGIPKDVDYFAIRTGILLMNRPNSALRHYLLTELELYHQDSVIQSWAKQCKRPVPEKLK
ncbi:MAG: tetratricopeptide repeat protein [Bdellovibrionia bacterium]